MATGIKISSLNPIGANIAYTTLVPVVNMSGAPTTEKATAQVLGNLILNGAGGSYFPAAAQAVLAQSVTNAAQPNITSVGTLTSLNVTGNISAGSFSGDGSNLTNVTANLTGYATETYVNNAISNIDLSSYATETYVNNAISNIDLSSYATQTYVNNAISNIDLSSYATQTYVNDAIANVTVDFLNVASNITPSTDNTYSLGSNTNSWQKLWLSNGVESTSNILNLSVSNVGLSLSTEPDYGFPPTIIQNKSYDDTYPWIVGKATNSGPEISYTNATTMADFYAPNVFSSSMYIYSQGFSIDLDYNGVLGTSKNWTFDNDGKLYLSDGGLEFYDGTIQTTGYTRNEGARFKNGTIIGQVQELNCGGQGLVDNEYASIFRFSNVNSNFTGNLINLNFDPATVSLNRALSVSVIITQGATPYVCNAIQIEGVPQTILWQGSASAPTGNANKDDIITFSIIRTGPGTTDYIVYGQLVSFG